MMKILLFITSVKLSSLNVSHNFLLALTPILKLPMKVSDFKTALVLG